MLPFISMNQKTKNVYEIENQVADTIQSDTFKRPCPQDAAGMHFRTIQFHTEYVGTQRKSKHLSGIVMVLCHAFCR